MKKWRKKERKNEKNYKNKIKNKIDVKRKTKMRGDTSYILKIINKICIRHVPTQKKYSVENGVYTLYQNIYSKTGRIYILKLVQYKIL